MAVSFQTTGFAVCFVATVLPALLIVGQPAQGAPSQTCNSGGSYQSFGDDSNCNSFYICTNGNPDAKTCPSNLHFSEDSKVCVWPYTYQDDCARNNAVRECSGSFSGRIAHPTDCKSYYDCSDTTDTPASFGPKQCPGERQYFDYRYQSCYDFLQVDCGPQREGLPCFKDSCYLMDNQDKTWQQSENYCQSKGGHLVAIETAEEQQFLEELFTEGSGEYWVGGLDTAVEDTWTWVPDSTPVSYTNWRSDQPNNDGDCMLVAIPSIIWLDRGCDDSKPAICEIKTRPEYLYTVY